MLAVCPALLVGSYVGFVRGELLQSKRRWVLPSLAALATFLGIALILVVSVRWETCYVRSRVERIEWSSLTGGGSAVSLLAYGSPVKHRALEAGWFRLGESQHRSKHAVCVDLKTGNELLVRRETKPPVVSPDGKLAAVLCGPRPLTWFDEDMGFPLRTVEIWDLRQHRLLYRGLPEEFMDPVPPELYSAEWSPDSSWLALTSSRWRGEWGADTLPLMFMRPDGSQAHEIELGQPQSYWYSCDWAPSGEAVYVLEEGGRLARHSLAEAESETIWEAASCEGLPSSFRIRRGKIAVSPDGWRVAVALVGYPHQDGAIMRQTDRFFVFLVAADGSRSQLIFKSSADPVSGDEALHFTWSQDGKTIYLSRVVPVVRGSRTADRRAEMIVWREGAKTAVLSALPAPSSELDTALLPGGNLLILSGKQLWFVCPDGKLRSMPRDVVRSFADSALLGLDNEGRAILVKRKEGGYIAAADLTTGEVTRIYP